MRDDMILCKCMNADCRNQHWADLSDEAKAEFERAWRKEHEEEKVWPPKTIETK